MNDTILYEKVGAIAKIWLNRPERRNTFTKKMTDEFAEALDCADKDPEVRVIIIQAKGKDFNCSYDHGDPEVILAAGEEEITYDMRRKDTEHDINFWFKVFDIKKPVITGIQGECLACGVWIAQLSDVLVASTDINFHAMEFSFGGNATEILPLYYWKLPMNIAMEFALTGNPIDAEAGYRYGLFNHVVEPDKIDETCMKLANRMLRLHPFTLNIHHEIGMQAYEVQGMRQILPLAKEAYNVANTAHSSEMAAQHWEYGRIHGLDKLNDHFMELMDQFKTLDPIEDVKFH